jgi:hypothetical protein
VSRLLILLCTLCAGCALDWSGSWPVPLVDSIDQTRPIDRRIEDSGGADTGVLEPCAKPAKEVDAPTSWLKSMRICAVASGVTQCQAVVVCGASWHLCANNEYHARGGELNGPSPIAAPAWIAACVRDGPVVKSAAEPSVCAQCIYNDGLSLPVEHSCSSTTMLKSTCTHIGIVAEDVCNEVGLVGQMGRWRTAPSADRYTHVVCCRF